MQWLQDQNQSNVYSLNHARRDASRHFKKKKKKYLKAKFNQLETNSENKNIRELYRSINSSKKGYQPKANIVKDENGDVFADCHSILSRWRKYFSRLLNVHWDSK